MLALTNLTKPTYLSLTSLSSPRPDSPPARYAYALRCETAGNDATYTLTHLEPLYTIPLLDSNLVVYRQIFGLQFCCFSALLIKFFYRENQGCHQEIDIIV
jgi:hypothetical protein